MEYLWYILAAVGAGVGTGLAGLSAATIMVPIFIVLCPSFAGENGAYQATAIALASDILGSAVTSYIYIKNKNIDLRRGWIMLACIVTMCIAGSAAAFAAGSVVLGSFSLFLTFCIGIRFLVKPDTQRKETLGEKEKLDAKGIAISLFFGLTIGFGTGFVGSGGGMMMLVVFTAFLGMKLKPAVGTSTFIMTFTALIASVSHILIEPSIVLEKWPALVICMITAALSSIVSAQFANRVDNRTVGLVAGAVLTVLGAVMIVLNYWDTLSKITLFVQTLRCTGIVLLYFAVFASLLLILNVTLKIPRYIFRKMLHIAVFGSVIVLVMFGESWLAAALTSVLFALLIYPILYLLENGSWYANLFVQKKKGEVKRSLLLLFFTIAAVIVFTWGVLNMPILAVAAVLMWGIGDAAAAIIGIRFGRHKITWKIADSGKSWEGTAAMFLSAFASGFITLFCTAPLTWYWCLALVIPSAAAAAFVEMISKGGNDTIFVPLAVTLSLTFLVFVTGCAPMFVV